METKNNGTYLSYSCIESGDEREIAVTMANSEAIRKRTEKNSENGQEKIEDLYPGDYH